MANRVVSVLAGVVLAAIITGCAGSQGPERPGEAPQATAVLIYDQLRTAFQIGDRETRRKTVLSLTRDFLSDIEARDVGDDAASALLTDFSQTAPLLLNNPAIVQRHGSQVVVGLPDGLGLYLYDLSSSPDSPPLELSEWIAGLSSIQVTWQASQTGVLYFTTGADHVTTAHFVLAEESRNEWRVGWFGDENPDWWFNTRNATITVTPDLQTLKVVGESAHNSAAFDELPGLPHRSFTVEWHKIPSGYAMSPQPGSPSQITSWLWQVAVPSPYATLVEFIERLRINDTLGAARLATEPQIVSDAMSFGLDFPENRFQVVSADPSQITIKSVRGTFVVSFQPPAAGADRPWRIDGIAPIGAAPPTP